MSDFISVFKRTEMKYLINIEQYKRLRTYLDEVAEVDEYGKTRINNIYFDTPDYRLVRTSLEKPLYKEKLRLRTYGRTDTDSNSFIEIKKKYDGIVYKRRISGEYGNNYEYLLKEGESDKESGENYLMRGSKADYRELVDNPQIFREIESFKNMYRNLTPAMKICYDRIAMIGKQDKNLRITFDSNITWSTDSFDLKDDIYGEELLKSGQQVMEIKVTNAMPLELARKLSELKIYPSSYSKYGSGYKKMITKKAI